MNKMPMLAVLAAFTMSASAATVTWGFGSGELFLAEPGGDATIVSEYTGKAPESSAKLVLAYLGATETIDYNNVTVADEIDYSASGDFFSPKQSSIAITAAGGYSAGDWFAILWYDGTKYSGAYDLAEWPDNDVGPVALGSMITATVQVTSLDADKQFQQTVSNASSEGAAALVVPEPSTAMLALAGLALLIKRRRA